MRITREEISYNNILWFAIDDENNVILAQSFESEVPKFVSENALKAEQLAKLLCGVKAIDRNRAPAIDCDLMTEKGYYCFLCNDPYEDAYRLYKTPPKPIKLYQLPRAAQDILINQTLSISVALVDSFSL